MNNNILISSELIFISSSVNGIYVESAKDTVMSTAGSFTVNVGPQGSKDIVNTYRINSPYIELGYQSDPTLTLEAVPKGDILIQKLEAILGIMNDIVNNPDEVKAISGEIENLRKSLSDIKSTITKTY
jgi:hypothetical protein